MSYQSSSDDNSSSESEGEMRILPVKKQRGRPKKTIAKAGARSGGARSGGAMSGGNSITDFLKKHKGKRKDAATDLGISERTLYRKLKEYDIED